MASAVVVQVTNNTGSTITYSAESLTVGAGATVTVPNAVLVSFLLDPQVHSDLQAANTTLTDTVTTYKGDAAEAFLLQACQNLADFDKTGSGTIAALNAAVIASVGNNSIIVMTITGTWSGSINLQGSIDGVSYYSIQGFAPSNGNWTNGTTTNIMMVVPCGGYKYVQLIAASWVSGTATVNFNASLGNNVTQVFSASAAAFSAQVQGPVSPGNPATNELPVLIGVSQGGNVATQTATSIAGQVSEDAHNSENLRTSYSAAIIGLVAASSATDILVIAGSATKTIRVTRLEISATQTTAATNDIQLVMRSAADTGGTSSTLTAVPHDANDAAATATVKAYTVNPTSLGAAVGTIRAQKMFIPGTGTLFESQDWDFGTRNGKPIVLRGTAQVLALNLNAKTLSGNSFDISIEWTEDAT